MAAFIHPERGFLVYDVFVLDSNDNVHRILVDPGNGKVLSNQPMSLMDIMAMMHPAMGMGMDGRPWSWNDGSWNDEAAWNDARRSWHDGSSEQCMAINSRIS